MTGVTRTRVAISWRCRFPACWARFRLRSTIRDSRRRVSAAVAGARSAYPRAFAFWSWTLDFAVVSTVGVGGVGSCLCCVAIRGVLASPKVVSRARRWSPVRAPLSLRLAAHKPTAQWPPAPPSTALEAPALGQLCLRSASAVTRWFKIPKGPKKRARTRTAQTQMVQPPTTASPRSPGGSARRQATTTAL
jgi:hypothetical protein